MRIRDRLCRKPFLVLLAFLFAIGHLEEPDIVHGQASESCRVASEELLNQNWWNYYERGTTYAHNNCWEEAVQDFKTAIELRPGDTKRARTYGIRVIAYFPHRELGIVYYHLGRYRDAIRELDTSLRHVSTENEKAINYLNRAHNAS